MDRRLAPAMGEAMANQQVLNETLEFPEIQLIDERDARIPPPDVAHARRKAQDDDRERAAVAAGRLQATFPRIHEQLGALWGTAACEDYLDKLIFDERGDRTGFPPPVLEAILILQRIHYGEFGSFRPATPWDVITRR